MNLTRESRYLSALLLFFLLINLISLSFPFFWDTILYSRIAHHFLGTGLETFVLPEHLDTGNPPFFPLLLAFAWETAGKSLWISHLLMLPFLLGTGFLYFRLAVRTLPAQMLPAALVLLALEPSLLVQSTMVSLDVIIVFFYLLGLEGVTTRRRAVLAIAVAGLSLTNLRGAFMGSALLLTQGLLEKRLSLRMLLPYLPGAALTLGWLAWHYHSTGWMLSSPAEWAEHREVQSPAAMFKNLLIIAWRFFDGGKAILWLTAGILLLRRIMSRRMDAGEKQLLLLTASPLMLLSLAFIPFSNPIGHRYFMVINILLLLVVTYELQFVKLLIRRALLYLFMLCLAAGHFIIYPPPFANGWDVSLAHLYYFPMREEMSRFISAQSIPPEEVASDFPSNASFRYTNLWERELEYANKYFGGIDRYRYVLQSSVNNRFSSSELKELSERWMLVKELRSGPLYMRLYKNPGFAKSF